MKDERAVLAIALTALIDRAGGSVDFTEDELRGSDRVVVIDGRHFRTAGRQEFERERDEQEHRAKGHVRCECDNWIERVRNGWAHVGGLGDEIALHIASPK